MAVKSKRQKAILSVISLLLAVVSVFGLAASAFAEGDDDNVATKQEKSYEIAVVFDNSISMYEHDKVPVMAWSRAKYSMEIFASMLDFPRDRLGVYPMWKVTTDGSRPTEGKNEKNPGSPFFVNSKDEIDLISNMFTIGAHQTPFDPVETAINDLKTSNRTNKWLVILTDGAFDYIDKDALQKKLEDIALGNPDINIQYLGIGDAYKLSAKEETGFFTSMAGDTGLKDELVKICNRIFDRHELTDGYDKSTGKVDLDISMDKIIVFVQGQNAKINSLTGPGNKTASVKMDSGQRKYSNISAGNIANAIADETLFGQVVIFDGPLEKGAYELNCTGAENVEIFYEPAVKIIIKLKNAHNGVEVEQGATSVNAGKYTITYGLYDTMTNEEITNSKRLGKTKLSAFTETPDGTVLDKNIKSGSEITIEKDTPINIHVSGTYLGDFSISTKDRGEGFRFSSITRPSDLALKITTEQTESWFYLKEHEKWKPIKVRYELAGNKLSDEKMAEILANTQITIKSSIGSEVIQFSKPVICPGESAISFNIAVDEKGNYVKPAAGEYKINVRSSVKDEYNNDSLGETTDTITVSNIPLWLHKFAVIIIISAAVLVLVIIIIFLHLIKLLPKKLVAKDGEYTKGSVVKGTVTASITRNKGFTIKKMHLIQTGTVSANAVNGGFGITMQVEAETPLFRPIFNYQKSQRRSFRVLSVSGTMDIARICGTDYDKETFNSVNKVFRSGSTIVAETTHGESKRIECKLEFKK